MDQQCDKMSIQRSPDCVFGACLQKNTLIGSLCTMLRLSITPLLSLKMQGGQCFHHITHDTPIPKHSTAHFGRSRFLSRASTRLQMVGVAAKKVLVPIGHGSEEIEAVSLLIGITF